MPAELTSPAPAALPLDDVLAAISTLADPTLPGQPCTVGEIVRLLPRLIENLYAPDREQPAEGPPSLAAEAESSRWLWAADAGELPAE